MSSRSDDGGQCERSLPWIDSLSGYLTLQTLDCAFSPLLDADKDVEPIRALAVVEPITEDRVGSVASSAMEKRAFHPVPA